jgi:hypothetical protein
MISFLPVFPPKKPICISLSYMRVTCPAHLILLGLIILFIFAYKAAGKIVALCILIFMVLDNRREDKRFWTEW